MMIDPLVIKVEGAQIEARRTRPRGKSVIESVYALNALSECPSAIKVINPIGIRVHVGGSDYVGPKRSQAVSESASTEKVTQSPNDPAVTTATVLHILSSRHTLKGVNAFRQSFIRLSEIPDDEVPLLSDIRSTQGESVTSTLLQPPFQSIKSSFLQMTDISHCEGPSAPAPSGHDEESVASVLLPRRYPVESKVSRVLGIGHLFEELNHYEEHLKSGGTSSSCKWDPSTKKTEKENIPTLREASSKGQPFPLLARIRRKRRRDSKDDDGQSNGLARFIDRQFRDRIRRKLDSTNH